MKRSLASRGFALPPMPPVLGNASWDAGHWNGRALKAVIIAFLDPDADYNPRALIEARETADIINSDAVENGFALNMFWLIGAQNTVRRRELVAEYIGLPPESIWPHRYTSDDGERLACAARGRPLTLPPLPLVECGHVSAPAVEQASPWRHWKAATRDLLRWWWSLVA